MVGRDDFASLDESTPPPTALVLAGAVAKGAFQAGVLEQIAQAKLSIVRIVAASAGALNAGVFAAGIRYGRIELATEILTETWVRDAHWWKFLRPSLSGVLRGGLSSSREMATVVARALTHVVRGSTPPIADITLQLVVAALQGMPAESGPHGSATGDTTFEHIMEFSGPSFDSADGRRAVVMATMASAAFPLLFTPVHLDGIGYCVDGGAVNNTPVSYGLDSPEVRRVIVVTDNARQLVDQAPPRGFELVGRVLEMLVNERLVRDLVQSRKVNEKLARVESLTRSWGLSKAQRAELREALGWRAVELIEIRPEQPLAGTPFSGLADRGLREQYIDAGRVAGAAALARL